MSEAGERRLMGCTHSTTDPASRFRFLQYGPYLEQAGWHVEHRPNYPSRYWRSVATWEPWRKLQTKVGRLTSRGSRWRDIHDAAKYDVIFVNRDLFGGELCWEQRMVHSNPRMIFDFDDAIFLGEKRQKHIEWVCKNAAWVTVGNEYLAEFVRKVTDRVTVIPSVVDADKYRPAWHESVQTQLRVGWLGSDLSIRETLFPYIDMLSRLQRRIGFQFVIVSKPEPRLPSADLNWQYVEWSPSIEENIAEYLDVGLMPLVDDEFQRGKCGMKILQYMAGGIPAIASPIGVNRNIIQHGVTGFLANSEAEWGAAIEALQKSPALRGKIGQAGRQHCEQNYSLKVWLPKLLTVLEKVAVRKATSG